MTELDGTRLTPAGPEHTSLLAELVETYVRELAPLFPHVQVAADGRYGYPGLSEYQTGSERRFAFVIEQGADAAGFVLARHGSPLPGCAEAYDIAEFFVLPRYRGEGVGRRAALLLWARLPGRWAVRASEANPAAVAFWARVLGGLAPGRVRRWTHPGRSAPWQVFDLDAPAAIER